MAPGRYQMDKPDKSSRPRHYRIDRWVDFARGLEPESEAAKMIRHVEHCAACRDLMIFCAKLKSSATFLLQPTPPVPPLNSKKTRL